MSDPSEHAPQFNLVDRPWLPCVRQNGDVAVLSLRQVLCEAHQVKDLSLDAATQFPPILRLLLAVVHRALGWHEGEQHAAQPRTEEAWAYLWRLQALPAEQINGYLDAQRPRFELFDDDRPFLQVAGLRAANDGVKPITLVIPYVAAGHNTPLFSAARDAAPPPLSVPEAARWLPHVMAYDTAAIKTGAKDDPQVRDGKTTGNPTGPLGQMGAVVPTGPSLWHTIMFNLLVLNDDLSPDGDLPVWERRDPLTSEWRPLNPKGLLELYTWPSRRIRLIPDGDGVPGVLVCAGDRADIASLSRLEPHTAWQRSANQEKKLKREPVYMPVPHRPGRELWRGLEAVLASAETDKPDRLRPAVLSQLGRASRSALVSAMPMVVRAFGVTYGNQSAVIDETYADDLPLPIVLLAEAGKEWQAVAVAATKAADDAAGRLAGLAADLARAAGCTDPKLLDGRRRSARSRLNATLDQPFRRWIAHLAKNDKTPQQALTGWCQTVRRHTATIGEELLSRIPDTAVRGHPVKNGSSETLLTAAQAEAWFWHGLAKALAVGATEEETGA